MPTYGVYDENNDADLDRLIDAQKKDENNTKVFTGRGIDEKLLFIDRDNFNNYNNAYNRVESLIDIANTRSNLAAHGGLLKKDVKVMALAKAAPAADDFVLPVYDENLNDISAWIGDTAIDGLTLSQEELLRTEEAIAGLYAGLINNINAVDYQSLDPSFIEFKKTDAADGYRAQPTKIPGTPIAELDDAHAALLTEDNLNNLTNYQVKTFQKNTETKYYAASSKLVLKLNAEDSKTIIENLQVEHEDARAGLVDSAAMPKMATIFYDAREYANTEGRSFTGIARTKAHVEGEENIRGAKGKIVVPAKPDNVVRVTGGIDAHPTKSGDIFKSELAGNYLTNTLTHEHPWPKEPRGVGQNKTMGNVSANSYYAYFFPNQVKKHTNMLKTGRFEWLHLIGSSLGGPTIKNNLVAGSYDANTRMIPLEAKISEMKKDLPPPPGGMEMEDDDLLTKIQITAKAHLVEEVDDEHDIDLPVNIADEIILSAKATFKEEGQATKDFARAYNTLEHALYTPTEYRAEELFYKMREYDADLNNVTINQGVERILHMIQIANDDDTQKPTSLKAISDFIADDNFNALEIDEAAGTNAAKQLSAKTIGQLNFRTVLPVE